MIDKIWMWLKEPPLHAYLTFAYDGAKWIVPRGLMLVAAVLVAIAIIR
jgi:hypothetical protein